MKAAPTLVFAKLTEIFDRPRFVDEQRRHHSGIAHASELEGEDDQGIWWMVGATRDVRKSAVEETDPLLKKLKYALRAPST